MTTFQKLVFQNLFSFGCRQALQLEDQGVIQVVGRNVDEPDADSNRVGKSAIIEILVWCLFGRTIRYGFRNDLAVNRFHKRDAFATIHFSANSVPYRLTRYRKHKKHGNALLFWRGSRLISSRHEKLTQQKIESVLGMGYDVFCNSVIFGGARPFAALSDAEQKKVLESFLHFEQFDMALKRTKLELAASSEQLEAVSSKVSLAREELGSCFSRLTALRESQHVVSKGQEAKLARLRARASSLRVKSDSLGVLDRSSLQSLRSGKDSALARLSVAEKSIHNCKKALFLTRKKTCPVCHQPINKRLLREHIASEVKKAEGQRQSAKVDHDTLTGKLSQAERQVRCLSNIEQEIQGLRREIASLRKEASQDPWKQEIGELIDKRSILLSRMLVLRSEEARLHRKLKDLHFWEAGFGNKGIKSIVVREALPTLNSKLVDYGKMIFRGSAKLEFVPTKQTKKGEERELFHVKYEAKKGADLYLGESSGGRKRVDICVLLVFSWLSHASNLLLVDELLDSLDETGRGTVMDILSTLRGTILVVTHTAMGRTQGGKVWTVVKEGGESRVEVA